MDGERELSDAWTGFTRASQDSSYRTKGHLIGTHGPGGDLQENKQPLAQTMYVHICGRICLMQRKRKQNKEAHNQSRS